VPNRRSRGASSDIHCFLLDVWPQFPAEGLFCHQVDAAAEQVFKKELDAEVAI